MNKHMTFDERVSIQQGLDMGKSFADIAREIGRSRSTISREVGSRKTVLQARKNVCVHRKECNLPKGCKTRNCITPNNCQWGCTLCKEGGYLKK